ncbi:ABC transporter substrate-binding protein [Arthrobacter sp. H-02-3]|uniref:ABC transporter substrate-binding protein n=1 Tax=Arthrobacter sp. H-02-3 TaxID=2703675 RepID=UPI00137ABFEF|nr:ABC transporter substrate-binding protein [Arthrobacter sp. H-02-3]
MLIRKKAAIAAAAILALSATGCAASVSAGTSSDSSNSRYGGTLTFLDPVAYTAFNVTNTLWSNSNVVPQLVDRLTYQDAKTGKIEPWLASSWDVSSDGLTYTFHLRKGVTFSDGTQLDAQVVKDNYDQHGLGDKAKGIAADSFFTGYVKSTVVDPSTVSITLSKPDAGFLQVTSIYRSGIVAKSTLEKDWNAQGQLDNLVGSGPFKVKSHDANNTTITLERRDDYDWAPQGFAHQGKAYLKEIVYKTVAEDSVRMGSVKSGQAQIARNILPTDEAALKSAGITVNSYSVQGEVNHLGINLNSKFVDNENVRLALQAATNRQELRDTVLSDSYGVAKSVLPQADHNFTDQSSYLQYDQAKAEKLLADAGFTKGSDGFLQKDGNTLGFTIYVAPYYQTSKKLLQLLSQEWGKVGVQLTVKEVDSGTYSTKILSADTAFNQTQWSRADADVLRTAFGSEYGFANKVANPELDKLLQSQAEAGTPDARQKIVTDIQKYLLEHALEIPLYDETQVFALAKTVNGFATEPVARAELYDTWLSK